MLINRDTDYAIRALRALYNGGKKPLSVICEEEAIPQQFGYKILKKLAKAGYIEIFRGKEGGYKATSDFAKISLYDVMHVMENPMDVSSCLSSGYVCKSKKAKNGLCKVHKRLTVIQQSIDDQLSSIYLAEILSE